MQDWQARTYHYDGSQPHAVTSLTSGQSSVGSYQYDQNGNMTCRVENGVTWKQDYNTENRISAIHKMSGDCITGTILESWLFGYDGDGVRVSTAHFTGGTADSLSLYYFGGAYEVRDSQVIKYYSFAGQTVAMHDGTELQYLLTDHLGSVVAVTNASGTLTSQQRYLPFGEVRTNVGTIGQTDYGYTGQRNLGEMGLMDYKARFYDAYLNRFIQPDTLVPSADLPQTWNRYSYSLNNPIRYNDPSGHCATGAIVDTVICVVSLVGVFFILNSTSDTPQDLSAEEAESRQLSFAIGVTTLSLVNPAVEAASDFFDCVSGIFCDPVYSAIPGSATLYTKLDDLDAPRLSPSQIRQIDQLAHDLDCPITICGGYAATALEIENRRIAFELDPHQTVGPVPYWRNTGIPEGNDLDYWTPFGVSLPKPVRDGLTEIFGTPQRDNYKKYPGNLFSLPPGSLTFLGDGTAIRKTAPWQKPYDWVKAE